MRNDMSSIYIAFRRLANLQSQFISILGDSVLWYNMKV